MKLQEMTLSDLYAAYNYIKAETEISEKEENAGFEAENMDKWDELIFHQSILETEINKRIHAIEFPKDNKNPVYLYPHPQYINAKP